MKSKSERDLKNSGPNGPRNIEPETSESFPDKMRDLAGGKPKYKAPKLERLEPGSPKYLAAQALFAKEAAQLRCNGKDDNGK